MEHLTKRDLLILSTYTGHFIGVSGKEVLDFLAEVLDRQVSGIDLIERKSVAEYKGLLRAPYEQLCKKMKRIAL